MGKLIIVSAPSGTGKSTLVRYLLSQDLNLEFSISATSRPPRDGEQDGVDYYFLTPEEFKRRIANGEFLEYEEVYPKWALLTTHCGRRTFVVTALRLGIPVEVIMRWTGHSSFEAMKPYAKIVDEVKEKSMSRFDNFL